VVTGNLAAQSVPRQWIDASSNRAINQLIQADNPKTRVEQSINQSINRASNQLSDQYSSWRLIAASGSKSIGSGTWR
jgi:hypothetical protein